MRIGFSAPTMESYTCPIMTATKNPPPAIPDDGLGDDQWRITSNPPAK
jgi:hypothetical protein